MADWQMNIGASEINKDADINDLKEEISVAYPDYALVLPRYSKLDGRFNNVQSIDIGNIGYMSEQISDKDGLFSSPISITLTFAKRKTSNGIKLIFNQLSNDYCSDLSIAWYLYDEKIAEESYTPDSYEYFCEAKVGLFDKAVVTFKKTNKPYRYLWLSTLENARLTQGEGLRIVYNDIAFLGKEHATIESSNASYYSNLEQLIAEKPIEFPYYSMALPRYSKLDGNFINAPDVLKDMGFVSNEISDANGDFKSQPSISLTLSETIESVGIELYANNATGDYCDEVNIKWYFNDELLSDKNFSPDSVNYICTNRVNGYNRLVINFKHTNKPYRRAVLTGFEFGAIRVFTKDNIISCGLYNEISPIGESLPISTLDYTIKNIDYDFTFEKDQSVYAYFDSQILGHFYLKSSTRDNYTDYSMQTEDIISILNSSMHCGGFYNGADAKSVIENEIFKDINVKLDLGAIEGLTISGWLPYDTKRNNLAQICFALGLIVDSSFEEKVYIYPYDVSDSVYELKNKFIYANTLKIKQDENITGVNLTVHSWLKNTTDNPKELFKETLNGQALVKFNEPQYDLGISGGTISESGDNYAVINGTGQEVVLTGRPYDHIEQIISIEKANVYRNKKFLESKDATLVTSANGSEVLDRLYNFHAGSQSAEMSLILNDFKLADWVTLNVYEESKKGIISSLDMTFTGEIKAEAKIKCLT